MASVAVWSLHMAASPWFKELIAVLNSMIGPRGAGLDPENPHWVRGTTSLGSDHGVQYGYQFLEPRASGHL